MRKEDSVATSVRIIEIEARANPLLRPLPILGWLPRYDHLWLRFDLFVDLTVVALSIPKGMAYTQIAGVPHQTAFCAASIDMLLFAIFGSSRHLVLAVSAAIAIMSYATLSLIAESNMLDFIMLSAALVVMTGLLSILAGVLKLGQVAQFLSESVMVGFVTGLAL
jgi:SulP family sulfate permease